MQIQYVVRYNKLPAIAARFPAVVQEKKRQAIRAGADVARQRARVRTGEMRAGITELEDGITSGGVKHTIYNEFGTRHMSAQPMFRPAAEIMLTTFMNSIAGLEGEL